MSEFADLYFSALSTPKIKRIWYLGESMFLAMALSFALNDSRGKARQSKYFLLKR